jgi:hypothetical protein
MGEGTYWRATWKVRSILGFRWENSIPVHRSPHMWKRGRLLWVFDGSIRWTRDPTIPAWWFTDPPQEIINVVILSITFVEFVFGLLNLGFIFSRSDKLKNHNIYYSGLSFSPSRVSRFSAYSSVSFDVLKSTASVLLIQWYHFWLIWTFRVHLIHTLRLVSVELSSHLLSDI